MANILISLRKDGTLIPICAKCRSKVELVISDPEELPYTALGWDTVDNGEHIEISLIMADEDGYNFDDEDLLQKLHESHLCKK